MVINLHIVSLDMFGFIFFNDFFDGFSTMGFIANLHHHLDPNILNVHFVHPHHGESQIQES